MTDTGAGVESARVIEAAATQVVFREVNERIKELDAQFGGEDTCGWVCECKDVSCSERIEMTLPEYERLRDGGNRFAVKPGHELREVEDVIEQCEGYLVVAKRGAGGAFALNRDPRSVRS